MDHLKKETIENVRNCLWDVRISLKGLGGLFTQGNRDLCLEDDEFFGIGQLLKGLSQELSRLEAILNNYNCDCCNEKTD